MDTVRINAHILKLAKRYSNNPQEIDLDTPIEGSGLDSLAAFEMVYEIEEQNAIELDDIDLASIKTFGDLSETVQKRIAQG